MAQSSLTTAQQRQILRIMRVTRLVAFGLAALLTLVAIVLSLFQGDVANVGSAPHDGAARAVDGLTSWALGVALIGLLLTAIGMWIRRLLLPKCARCSSTTTLGAKFCHECGLALPSA